MNFKKALKFHQNEDLEEARKYYLLNLTDNPKHYETLFNLGMLELQLNKYDSAQYYFNEIISINPNDVNTIANLGICFNKIGLFC